MMFDDAKHDQRRHRGLRPQADLLQPPGGGQLRAKQHAEIERFAGKLHSYLADAQKLGEISGTVDLDLATQQLLVLIDGISAERVLYPDRVPPALQERMLAQLLDGLSQPPA